MGTTLSADVGRLAISSSRRCFGRGRMLWTLLVILLLMWALGLGFGVAGNLVHILLVVAVIVLVVNLLQGRRVG